MSLRQCVAAILLVLPAGAALFEFPEDESGRCGAGQDCVSSADCPAYRGLAAGLRHRSNICGFSGLQPRVCCDVEPVPPPPEVPLPPEVSPPPEVLPPLEPSEEPISATHPMLPTNCGKPSYVTLHPPYQRLHFISGGHDADLSKWPWMVLFGRWTNGKLGNWFCGGTLITDKHVLTAAHCLRPEQATTVGARIGDARLSSDVDDFPSRMQDRNISHISLHPGYSGGQHDLAVVQLAEAVELSGTTRPICLPPAGTEHVGADVTVAGRGLLEFGGQPADRLQEAPLRVVDPAACETTYQRVPLFERRFPNGFQDTVVCATSRTGGAQDACRGDSGGPLTVELPASVASTYQLVAVVSGGFGCGNPEFPGVYTKVSAHIDWITRQLN